MSRRSSVEFLQDILEAVKRIGRYGQDLSYENFMENIKTQDAVVRNLEIIGEAVKNIPFSLREKYPDIPWAEMAGIRDRLIHHYFGVNFILCGTW